MTTRVASLVADLKLEFGQFRRDFGRANQVAERNSQNMRRSFNQTTKAVQGLSQSMQTLRNVAGAALAGLGVQQLGAFTKATLDTASATQDMADVAGISATRLQTLRFAADQAGVGASGLDDGIKRLNRRLGLFVNDGGGPAAKALQQLGIATRITSGELRNTEQVFNAVIREFEGIESAAQKAALASQLFGEDAGPKMALLLNQGAAGVEALEQEFRNAGAVINEDLLLGAKRLSDEMNALGSKLRGAFDASYLEQFLAGQKGIGDNTQILIGLAGGLGEAWGTVLRVVTGVGSALQSLNQSVSPIFDSLREQFNRFAEDFFGGANDAARNALQSLGLVDPDRRNVDSLYPPADAATQSVRELNQQTQSFREVIQNIDTSSIEAIEASAKSTSDALQKIVVVQGRLAKSAKIREQAEQRAVNHAELTFRLLQQQAAVEAEIFAANQAALQASRDNLADLVSEPLRDASIEIKNLFADTFRDIREDNVDSFKDLADRFTDAFATMPEQFAASVAAIPFSEVANQLQEAIRSGGTFGFDEINQLFNDNPVLGGFAGAGIGGFAGSLVANRTGLGSTYAAPGAAIGGAVGGVIGTAVGSYFYGQGAIGGAAGTAIGSAAGFGIGSLFGEGRNNAQANLDLFTGNINNIGSPGFNNPNRQAVNALATDFARITRLLRLADVEIGNDLRGNLVRNQDGRQIIELNVSRNRDVIESTDITLRALQRSITSVANDNSVGAVFQRSRGRTPEQILTDLTFAQEFDDLINGVSNYTKATRALVDQYDTAIGKAKELGLAANDLVRPFREALNVIVEQAEDQVRSQISSVNNFFQQRINPLQQLLSTATFGAESATSPLQQFELAQRQFRDLANQARSGAEIDTGLLAQFGQTAITEAREFGASGPIFQDAIREVTGVINQQLNRERNAQNELLEPLEELGVEQRNTTEVLHEDIQLLVDQYRELIREVKAQRVRFG